MEQGVGIFEEMEQLDKQQPLHIEIPRTELFCVIAALQLAQRHPNFDGPTRKVVDSFIAKVTECFPEKAKGWIERGNDPGQDTIHFST